MPIKQMLFKDIRSVLQNLDQRHQLSQGTTSSTSELMLQLDLQAATKLTKGNLYFSQFFYLMR